MLKTETIDIEKIERDEADFEQREGVKSKLLEEAALKRGYDACRR